MELEITAHAITRYIERVQPRLTRSEAESEIRAALSRPLFSCPVGDLLTVWGCLNRVGYPFLAATDRARTRVETVGPRWHWREARRHWRRYMESNRGRVMNGPERH